jgi:hypothetical protein
MAKVLPFVPRSARPGARAIVPSATDVVCDAIARRVLLAFQYDGHHRVVAPYLHGTGSRGAEQLRGVQVAGTSRSGSFGTGKLWTIAKIVGLRATNEPFLPDDPSYEPDDSAMARIHCRVSLANRG